MDFTPSSLAPTVCRWALPFVVGPYSSSLGPTVRRWALPFVVVFTPFVVGPYRSSSCFTPFVVEPYLSSLCFTPFAIGFLPLRAAGAIAFVWFDTKTGAKGGDFEHPRVVQHEGGGSTWPRCHRRRAIGEDPRLSSLGPTHCPRVVVRSPLVPLVVAAPHLHGRSVFVSFAGHCWFSGWVVESLSWFIMPAVCRMA